MVHNLSPKQLTYIVKLYYVVRIASEDPGTPGNMSSTVSILLPDILWDSLACVETFKPDSLLDFPEKSKKYFRNKKLKPRLLANVRWRYFVPIGDILSFLSPRRQKRHEETFGDKKDITDIWGQKRHHRHLETKKTCDKNENSKLKKAQSASKVASSSSHFSQRGHDHGVLPLLLGSRYTGFLDTILSP